MAWRRQAPLVLLVWWCWLGGGRSQEQVYPLDACPASAAPGSNQPPVADGVYCDGLPEEFRRDGVYHMQQTGGSLKEVYCDMQGGRWNVLMRRGVDASGAAVPAASALSFAGTPGDASSFNDFKGDLSAEFFVGRTQLEALHTEMELLVEMTTANASYFAIFENARLTPTFSVGDYIFGTAGDGNLGMLGLSPRSFVTTCDQAWFVEECADLQNPELPHLTLPLDGSARPGGGFPWPTVQQPLTSVTLKARRKNRQRYCTDARRSEHVFALSPSDLERFASFDIRPSISNSDMLWTNVSITCKDNRVTPTDEMYTQDDYATLSGSTVFHCRDVAAQAKFNEIPLGTELICMEPCPADFTLVAPSTWDLGDVRRWTCLSPVRSNKGLGPYEANKRCAADGLQLLDFPVKKDRINWNGQTPSQLITALHYGSKDGGRVLRDLRGNYLDGFVMPDTSTHGDGKGNARCVGLFFQESPDYGIARQTACYNPNLKFACMTTVGCAPEQVLKDGFCYQSLPGKVKDHHDKICYPDPNGADVRNGMGAVPTPFFDSSVPLPGDPTAPVSVGAYRRHDGFFAMNMRIPDAKFAGGDISGNLGCALLDPTSRELSLIDCNDGDDRTVLCQYPGLPYPECPTRAQGIGTETPDTSKDTTSEGRVATKTCGAGLNHYQPQGPHSLEYMCMNLMEDWVLQTQADYPDISHYSPTCVFACDTSDTSVFPANSEFSTKKGNIVHQCVGALQTTAGATVQSQSCDHETYAFTGDVLPCDQCLPNPFEPDADFTAWSSWDNATRDLGAVVTFTCLPGLTTPSGGTEQRQNCTVQGWMGEVELCSVCEWNSTFNSSVFSTSLLGDSGFGQMVIMSCPPGLEAADGSVNSTAVCTPDAWNSCHDPFTCSHCSGEPLNVTEMVTISSSWAGERELGDSAVYTCAGNLTTAAGNRLQTINCTTDSWAGDIQPCDRCPSPPESNHSSIQWVDTSQNNESRLGSAVTFHCHPGLSTLDGQRHITSVCEVDGWTVCEQIECKYCAPLPDISYFGGTLTWDYADVNELGTEVTLTCEPGLATPSLETEQKIVCGLGGWNISDAQRCTVCTTPPPAPPQSLIPNITWTSGDPTAIYTCLETKKLPWGLTTFELSCSPTGWACVPECSYCAAPPPPPSQAFPTTQSSKPGGAAHYLCTANLQTAQHKIEQDLICQETGWEGDLLPCDECVGALPEPSAGQILTLPDNTTRNATIGIVAVYECVDGMEAENGTTYQTLNCTVDGWTAPQQPLPCDLCVVPPEPMGFMTRDWDGNRTVNSTVTYTCAANMTTMSNLTEQTIQCTDTGWVGDFESCAACRMDIPDPGNGTEARNVSWDGARLPGSQVYYTCYTGAVQTATCQDGAWQPAELPPCVTPTVLPPGAITMAPLPSYDPRYPSTTNYYWGTIENNMTSTQGTGSFTTGNGPPGFDSSVKTISGCMTHQRWASAFDPCALNPAGCAEGFSFSIWAKVELEPVETMFSSNHTVQRKYLVSTGGDMDGSPGVSMFIEGRHLSVLVSTGQQYWHVNVTGRVEEGIWNNFGVRWSPVLPLDEGGTLPGIQVFINNKTEGWTVHPATAQGGTAKPPLDPVEVMVGCHRTSTRPDYRDMCNCEFDELAMWTRPLPANETIFFLGGNDLKKAPNMDALKDMWDRCHDCKNDPKQFKSFISAVMVAQSTAPGAEASADPTVASTASADGTQVEPTADAGADAELPDGTPVPSPERVNKVRSMKSLIVDMTSSCKDPMPAEQLTDFLDLSAVVSASFSPAILSEWRSIEQTTKEDAGIAAVSKRFDDWVMTCGANTVMESPKAEVFVRKNEQNLELEVDKLKTFNIRQSPITEFPKGEKRGMDKVMMATELFHKPENPDCRFVDVTFLFTKMDTFGKSSPKRISTIELDVKDENQLDIDSPVMSLKHRLSGSDDPSLLSNCSPSVEQLRKYPLQMSISHFNNKPALKKPLFHEGDIDSGINRRVCVWWNPELSDYGGWDADGCKAVEYTEFYTKCACAHFGQFAIMLEKVPPKIVDLEYTWLKIIKYVCYCVSALLLLIFIIAVIKIKQLHEMFHLMRLNTAIGLLIGSIFMVLTDIPEIRADRHTCVAFGAVIQVFYLLAGTMVMFEGIADFMSVTTGAIGGKLKSYVALAWGVPLISLGYAMLMYLHDYGTDPRCMLGWPDEVKMTMFLPMMVAMIGAFIMTCLVSCNMQASRLRKENIVAEQLTVCKGFVFFAFYFVVTWTVGVFAYIKLGLQIPSFYPLFQVLNSTGGIIFFLFCGLGSERFRLLITGKAALRKQMLFSYTVTEQLSDSQQKLVEPEPEPEAAPEEETEYDPNARGPRGPLVA